MMDWLLSPCGGLGLTVSLRMFEAQLISMSKWSKSSGSSIYACGCSYSTSSLEQSFSSGISSSYSSMRGAFCFITCYFTGATITTGGAYIVYCCTEPALDDKPQSIRDLADFYHFSFFTGIFKALLFRCKKGNGFGLGFDWASLSSCSSMICSSTSEEETTCCYCY